MGWGKFVLPLGSFFSLQDVIADTSGFSLDSLVLTWAGGLVSHSPLHKNPLEHYGHKSCHQFAYQLRLEFLVFNYVGACLLP